MYISLAVEKGIMTIYGFRTRTALRELSEDSRISVTDMAKKLQCSRITAAKTIKELIEKYEIKFRIEIDEDKLGLSQRHLLILKTEKKPSVEDLKDLFSDDRYVNCALLCKGDFDIVLHVVSGNPMDYIVWESLLPGKLADYGVEIYPSELMLTNFGYFPISSATISGMAQNINEKDKALLALLSEDSRMEISEIASKLGMGRTTIHYRIHTLVKSGIIKRFTVSVNKPTPEYILAYATNYHFNKTSHLRSIKMMEYYKQYDTEMPLLNTFQILAPMSGSFRFLGIALFEDEKTARRDGIAAHSRVFNEERVKMSTARITGVVKGSYPFRNMDMEKNYRRFQWYKGN